ncbi:MAG: PTS sugar transporter subunit IIC [Bacilli bacterium]|jgi:uncharacterized membrane protein
MAGNKKDFFKKIKEVSKRFLNYLVKTMNGMALGLFSTLIIGVIIETIGDKLGIEEVVVLASILKMLTGVGIGIGVGRSLNLEGLRLIAAGVAGGIGGLPYFNALKELVPGVRYGLPGDPVVIYLCVVLSIELLNLVLRKKTPVDIILIPLASSLVAFGVFYVTYQPVSAMMKGIGEFIIRATKVQPFFMGIIIAVVMGMALTAPISSAAIAVSIGLGGLAGGAAVVGCCAQMLGFAVMSRKDNNIGAVISVGIGTSMLQFKNILKKPVIWLPPIIASAILGPLATMAFKTMCSPEGSGMGTSGLVGQFGTYAAMEGGKYFWLSVLLLQFALPIILVYGLDLLFRRAGLIKPGDLKI